MRKPTLEDFPYFRETNPPNLKTLVPGCSKPDCIPSIDNPKWLNFKQAANMYSANDKFILTKIRDTDYAVPLKILNYHEVVNFDVQGEPVAITFCPLCFTAKVYSRIVNNMTVELGVSGLLWNSSLVLYDRKTLSLFSQVLDKCIHGIFINSTLTQLPHVIVSFENLKNKNVLILDPDTGSDRSKYYDKEAYNDYLNSDKIIFPITAENVENPKSIVYLLDQLYFIVKKNLPQTVTQLTREIYAVPLFDDFVFLRSQNAPEDNVIDNFKILESPNIIQTETSFRFVVQSFYPNAIELIPEINQM